MMIKIASRRNIDASMDTKMKYYGITFLTFFLLSFWNPNAYSDRLYTWEDNEGVIHITQEPPPKNTKDVGVVTYTSEPEEPPNQKHRPQRRQTNKNQSISEGREKFIAATDAFEDDRYEYNYDDYTEHPGVRRHEKERRKHKEKVAHKNDHEKTGAEPRISRSEGIRK